MRLWHSIPSSTYLINSIFLVIICIYKVHVSDEEFLLATIATITEKLFFFLLPWQLLLGRQIPSSNHAAYQSKLPLGKWSQAHKVCSRKIFTKVFIFCPIILRSDPSIRVKNTYNLVDLICFQDTLFFINPLDGQFGLPVLRLP